MNAKAKEDAQQQLAAVQAAAVQKTQVPAPAAAATSAAPASHSATGQMNGAVPAAASSVPMSPTAAMLAQYAPSSSTANGHPARQSAAAATPPSAAEDSLVQPPLELDGPGFSRHAAGAAPSSSAGTAFFTAPAAGTARSAGEPLPAIVTPARTHAAALLFHPGAPSIAPQSATAPVSTQSHVDADRNGAAGTASTAATAAALAAAAPSPAKPAAATAASVASQLLSPARVSLVTNVFNEFERAWQLRQRAAAAASGQAAAVGPVSGLPLGDVGKALRKVGLRSGDLRTAKMTDETVHEHLHTLAQQHGWTVEDEDATTASLTLTQFETLTAATLFQH